MHRALNNSLKLTCQTDHLWKKDLKKHVGHVQGWFLQIKQRCWQKKASTATKLLRDTEKKKKHELPHCVTRSLLRFINVEQCLSYSVYHLYLSLFSVAMCYVLLLSAMPSPSGEVFSPLDPKIRPSFGAAMRHFLCSHSSHCSLGLSEVSVIQSC